MRDIHDVTATVVDDVRVAGAVTVRRRDAACAHPAARTGRVRWPALVAVTALVVSACGSADDGATESTSLDFYAGETITFLLPVGTGGQTDRTNRLIAEWLPNYLEGSPATAVENMPGGGQMLGSNHYDNSVERDGLTLIGVPGTTTMNWALDIDNVEYDMAGWEPIIAFSGGDVWYAHVERSGISSLDDLISGDHNELFFAGATLGGSDLVKLLAFDLLEVEVETTWGYDGRGAGRIAWEQGESNIDVQGAGAYYDAVLPFIESGEAVPLFTLGLFDEDINLIRDPAWPDLPDLGDVYEQKYGEPPSGDLFMAYMLGGAISRAFDQQVMVHADAPPEAIEALHDAFGRMADDPAFQQAVDEQLGSQILIGPAYHNLINDVVINVPQSVVDYLIEHVRDQYGYDLVSGQ